MQAKVNVKYKTLVLILPSSYLNNDLVGGLIIVPASPPVPLLPGTEGEGLGLSELLLSSVLGGSVLDGSGGLVTMLFLLPLLVFDFAKDIIKNTPITPKQ